MMYIYIYTGLFLLFSNFPQSIIKYLKSKNILTIIDWSILDESHDLFIFEFAGVSRVVQQWYKWCYASMEPPVSCNIIHAGTGD